MTDISPGIPFLQYLLPDGRKKAVTISRSPEIEALAQDFIDRGYWFECEILSDGIVSLTACARIDGESVDVAMELVENGQGVPETVDRLVRRAAAWRSA